MMDLLNLGKLPISEANPSGQDIRNEEIYALLLNEIEKRNSLSADTVVDWNKVVNISYDILLNHSKDILVFSYLCIGLLYTQNLPGLVIGIQIFRDLLKNYWQDVYPIRLNGRINAINWWIDTTNEKLKKLKPQTYSLEDRDILDRSFSEIEEFFINNNLPELDGFKSLINQSMSLILTDKEINNNSTNLIDNLNDQAEIKTNPSNSESSSVIIPKSSIDNTNDISLLLKLDDVLNALLKINDTLYEDQMLSYQVFKINRFVAWLDVTNKPVFDDELKTLLSAPDEMLQQAINNAYEEKNWLELIKLVELQVVNFRFWFDLSFYAYMGLKNMNQTTSANEVMYATKAFVKRLNGIEHLFFSDGTPFANEETQDWLTSFNDNPNDMDNTIIYSKANINFDFTHELLDANILAEDGKIEDAINNLHSKIMTSKSMQERFLRIMQFCQFVIKVGYGELSKAFLKELMEQVKRHKLEVWDPELSTTLYMTILNISKQKKGVKLDEGLIQEALSQLTLINPLEAKKFIKF